MVVLVQDKLVEMQQTEVLVVAVVVTLIRVLLVLEQVGKVTLVQ